MRAQVFATLLLMSTIQSHSAEQFRVTALGWGEVLQIRETPTVTSKVLGTLTNDNTVLTFGCTPHTPSGTTWCRVKKGGIVGWASRNFLVPSVGAPKTR
jgi:hypothetical protein